ncbi:hypothetical protein L1987_44554 [Smallanthus sonchifolius]|uniref:Uncharacterized protein n=1 Tax=Smallanthus sonchifolius TaxID=185202 RepID=A0ACB9GQF7_9ASTR|nr:hypothetical protein L1987_44554 [Smallanthus sonchifolius]
MYPTQSPSPPQNFGDGFPFQALSPARLNNNVDHVPINLPPSLDIDQSLFDSFSSLNLSQTDDQDRQMFPPQSLRYTYGSEGFSHTSLDESFRASNGVGYNQGVYSGVGHTTTRTVDPQRASSSRFDFDQSSSYLPAKERLYFTQHLKAYENRRSTNLYEQSVRRSSVNINTSSNNVNRNLNQNYLRVKTLHELRGWICVLARDQNGSEILQSKLESPTKEEIEIVLYEVMGSVADLMKDQYGNYLIQKLVSVCDDDQKAMIVRELTERSVDIILVCMSPYGTRAVQKLLENLKSPSQIMMVIRALHRCAAQLANDPNGHHVLQYCLLHFDSDFNQPILDQIADNCFKVATDRSGCCLLQACVEHSRGEVRNRLVTEIMANAIPIAEDPFGNYVLQHMVGLQSPVLTEVLVRQLQGNFASLSQNKYASNVVEKCLIESEPDISTKIILELVESPNSSSLLVDPYGNFVIQSALKVSKGFAFECLRKLISRNVYTMHSNLYGKKILEKIEKRRVKHN